MDFIMLNSNTMKKTLFYLLSILLANFITAQSLQNDVVSSGGGHSVAGTIDMEFNIGEVVTETSETTGLTITQGFLQPSISLTSIESDGEMKRINIFPNPVSDELTVEIPMDFNSSYMLVLTDVTGKLLFTEEMLPGINHIQLNEYPSGTYLLTISDSYTRNTYQAKIIKIR